MPGMPPPRTISQYFKPPVFAQKHGDSASQTPAKQPSPAPESSPLTELSSSFVFNNASPQVLPDDPASQLKRSLMRAAESASDTPSESLGPLDLEDEVPAPYQPPGSSFDQSQRIVKNGKEVVISSDGEDTDSVGSLEDPDALFLRFAKPAAVPASEKEADGDELASWRSKDDLKGGRFGRFQKAPKVYKNTLDTLVTQAVDDNETEATVAKLKAALERDRARDAAGDQANHLDENVLTSALGDQDDEMEMRRLLDAVRRTEAFELEKIWIFFDYGRRVAPTLEFPGDSVTLGTYLSTTLREPDSRERAFHSGILDFALLRGVLPDDVLLWIFYSVPSEPREGLRHAYCRAFKHATKERVKSLIRPDTIDVLFERLGATKEALAVSDPVVPHTLPKGNLPKVDIQRQTALLSVLELLTGIADLLTDVTREHALLLLFRLTLDTSLTEDAAVCSRLERTIHDLLFHRTPEEGGGEDQEGKPTDDFDLHLYTTLHTTIKDTVLQSRLLKHILPSSSHIAQWRTRLALSFIISDPAPLSEPDLDIMLSLRRIIDALKHPRFNIKKHKGKNSSSKSLNQGQYEYDYSELSATTELLNVVLDSGWSGIEFARGSSSREARRAFNAEVDTLADRIKKIFTAIEDSGASHLKRTLTKGALEALHYRVIYSVRTKPPPKRTLFESLNEQNQPKMTAQVWKGLKIEEKDAGIPIRSHDVHS